MEGEQGVRNPLTRRLMLMWNIVERQTMGHVPRCGCCDHWIYCAGHEPELGCLHDR